jgi:CheY-like chemotaxis protein
MAKVLLVEDDNNLREIYEARMQAEGYEVSTAMDGEEALVVAKKEMPDLVITDVMMPRISGFEMLDILRNTDGLNDVKIIMLTALGQAEDKTRADSLDADRYLVKSQVTLEDIVKAAKDLLGENTTPAPASEPVAATVTEAPIPVAPAPVAAAPVSVVAPTPIVAEPTQTPTPTPTLAPAQVAAMPVADAPAVPVAAVPAPIAPTADDALLSAAVNDLTNDTTPQTSAPVMSATPVAPVTPQADATQPTPVDDAIATAKKTISPIDNGSAQPTDLRELLAREGIHTLDDAAPAAPGDVEQPAGSGVPHQPGHVITPQAGVSPDNATL